MRIRFQLRDRIGGDDVGRNIIIEERMYEAGVGAVLQQAPNQIRQQILVPTNRRVHAHRRRRFDSRVKRLAHAVQALKFETVAPGRSPPCAASRRRCGRCVWRIAGRWRCRRGRDRLRAREIVDIGRGLGGEHGEVRAAHDLRALHFAVPIGALHQTRLDRRAALARERRQPLDQRRACAFDRPAPQDPDLPSPSAKAPARASQTAAAT